MFMVSRPRKKNDRLPLLRTTVREKYNARGVIFILFQPPLAMDDTDDLPSPAETAALDSLHAVMGMEGVVKRLQDASLRSAAGETGWTALLEAYGFLALRTPHRSVAEPVCRTVQHRLEAAARFAASNSSSVFGEPMLTLHVFWLPPHWCVGQVMAIARGWLAPVDRMAACLETLLRARKCVTDDSAMLSLLCAVEKISVALQALPQGSFLQDTKEDRWYPLFTLLLSLILDLTGRSPVLLGRLKGLLDYYHHHPGVTLNAGMSPLTDETCAHKIHLLCAQVLHTQHATMFVEQLVRIVPMDAEHLMMNTARAALGGMLTDSLMNHTPWSTGRQRQADLLVRGPGVGRAVLRRVFYVYPNHGTSPATESAVCYLLQHLQKHCSNMYLSANEFKGFLDVVFATPADSALRNAFALPAMQAHLRVPRACVGEMLGRYPTVANLRSILPFAYQSHLVEIITRFDAYRHPSISASRAALPADFAFYWSVFVAEVVSQVKDGRPKFDYAQLQAQAKLDVAKAGSQACKKKTGRPASQAAKRKAVERVSALTVPSPPAKHPRPANNGSDDDDSPPPLLG